MTLPRLKELPRFMLRVWEAEVEEVMAGLYQPVQAAVLPDVIRVRVIVLCLPLEEVEVGICCHFLFWTRN